MSQPDIHASFAELLRAFRERAGLSQEALAEKAGLTPNAIGALERSQRRHPYPNTRKALAEALDLKDGEKELFMHAGGRHAAVVQAAAGPTASTDPPVTALSPLPTPLTGLVGRATEINVVLHLLARTDVRLLTLTGPGGVGKTRLALETVIRLSSQVGETQFDGIALVDLTPIEDAALLLPSMVQALGLQDQGDLPLKQRLVSWLRSRRMLLLLDNFEHVLPAALELLDLLQNCPHLKLLVTSREALVVRGEQIYPVPPLSAPLVNVTLEGESPEGLVKHEAVQLFLQRAQAVRPDFVITPENALNIAQICAQLDGLPLAIELAAAHVLLYSPLALLAQLEKGLTLLKSRSRTLPARQQTMRDTIQWSYALLDEDEQALFRKLAVFNGSIALEAAGAVGSTNEDADQVAERVESLVRKNLLRPEFSVQSEPRVSMLETIRAYGLEMLAQNDELEATGAAHAEYFLVLAQLARQYLFGKQQPVWLLRLDREINNLRGAVRYALAKQDWATVVGIDWALWRYWWVRGLHRELQQWMEMVLDQAGSELSHDLLAQAELIVGSMAWAAGDHSTGLSHCQKAVRLCAGLENPQVEAVARMMLGCNIISSGQYEGTDALFHASVQLFEQTGELWGAAFAISYPGIGLLARKAYDRAVETFEAGLVMARRAGDPISMHQILYNLGLAWMITGQTARAAQAFAEGLALAEQVRDNSNQSYFMRGIAQIAVRSNPDLEGVRLLGAAESMQESTGVPAYRYELEKEVYQHITGQARKALGEERYEQTLLDGRYLTVEQARALAFKIADRIRGEN